MIKKIAKTDWMILLLAATLALTGCHRSPETRSAAHMEAGKRLMQKNDSARALLEFRNAVQLTPKNPAAYYQLSRAYLATGDVSKSA